MTRYVSIEKWRGPRAEVDMEPDKMRFTAAPARKSCRGCLFDGQWARVCNRVAELAALAELPNCERDHVVYVAVKSDPRQLEITGDEENELDAS
jgi:hypothetical protein